MSFYNLSFLLIFLPISFVIFYIFPNKYKKILLLFISLVFYSFGSNKALLVLLISIIINYSIGNLIGKKKKKKYLILGIVLNLFILIFFKYTNFLISNFNLLFSRNINYLNILLPLGVSFFTFQELSYLIDVYKKRITPEKNILNFSLYISFFPKIISGPITRYEKFKLDIINLKRPTIDDIYNSIKRISFGLFKVVVLAKIMGDIWQIIYDANLTTNISFLIAWFGIVCYSFYLYLDFSGYTDMAIGIGKLFGFDLPENFDYPYMSDSISTFWRRWHITLGSWFRDYIYIPLGGNRKGNVYFNLFIVFLLTGIWHGAKWNFVLWGIYHSILMIIERVIRKYKFYQKIPKLFKCIFTYLLVIIGWVLFMGDGILDSFSYLKTMFGFNSFNYTNFTLSYFFTKYIIIYFVLVIITCFPIQNIIKFKFNSKNMEYIYGIISIIILIISIIFIINNSYKPFIYAQF